jgi:hypothetical protein
MVSDPFEKRLFVFSMAVLTLSVGACYNSPNACFIFSKRMFCALQAHALYSTSACVVLSKRMAQCLMLRFPAFVVSFANLMVCYLTDAF